MTAGPHNQPLLVPVRPIRRVLNEAIKAAEADYGRGGLSVVVDQITAYSQRPAGGPPRTRPAVVRTIHRIRSGRDVSNGSSVKWVTFSFADTILCALGHQFDWLTHHELKRVYARAARVRTCDTVTNGMPLGASRVEA